MRHLILAAVLCSLPLSSPVRADGDSLRGGTYPSPAPIVTTEMEVSDDYGSLGWDAEVACRASDCDFPEADGGPTALEERR